MKNCKKISMVITIFILAIMLFSLQKVNAISNLDLLKESEYTEEYKRWIKLSDEEKAKQLEPRKYKISQGSNSVYLTNEKTSIFKLKQLLKSTPQARFSEQDIIPENVKIKNQGNTNSCWAFAELGALETNLAMKDYKNSVNKKIYDFSERHMIYATADKAFLDDKINNNGYRIDINKGGSLLMAQAYLTNGTGAINEEDMPFENNENNIDISEIQNKNIQTTVYDTIVFATPENDKEKSTVMLDMKSHISTYGGIYAGIYGANIMKSNYYNSKTGAIYCGNESQKMDHAVTIIGWDDNYSKSNFNSNNQPQNDGAWIVKNTWGEEYGDNGYMYISYEDAIIYKALCGIEKATNTKDYDNIYQNDFYGASKDIMLDDSIKKVYLANVFKRETSGEAEYLDKISLYTTREYKNIKVYVNPLNSDKSKENLQKIELKDETESDIKPGYHTIELKNQVELKGNEFAVVVEFETNGENSFAVESNVGGEYQNVTVNQNESFYTVDEYFEQNQWVDTYDISVINEENNVEKISGNTTIKAFTTYNKRDSETPNTPTTPGEPENPSTPTTPENPEEPNNPSTPEEPNNPTITEKPVKSNFEDVKTNVTNANIYLYTDSKKQEYVEMTVELTGIKIGSEQTSYTYYYAVSPNNNVNEINDDNWIEIPSKNLKKLNDGTYALTINMNSKDMEYLEQFEDITDSNKGYVFIKEIAKVNDQKIETVNIEEISVNNTDIMVYVDDEKIGNINDYINKMTGQNKEVEENQNKEQENNNDQTMAKQILPYAGDIPIIIAVILFVIISGGVAFWKYKNIDK